MVIIYELEDKMCWISKRQIDRDFLPVINLKHEIQEYKNKDMNLKLDLYDLNNLQIH